MTPDIALERLRVGLAERGIDVDTIDPAATVMAALGAIDRLRRPLAASLGQPCHHIMITPPPERVLVPIPYDPSTGRMLA